MLDYVAHYELYSEVLCINKDQKELKCHGTCQVKKQVAQVENQKEQKELPSSIKHTQELFQEAHFSLLKTISLSLGTKELISSESFMFSDFKVGTPTPPPLFS